MEASIPASAETELITGSQFSAVSVSSGASTEKLMIQTLLREQWKSAASDKSRRDDAGLRLLISNPSDARL